MIQRRPEPPRPGHGAAARATEKVPGVRRLSPLLRLGLIVVGVGVALFAASRFSPWGFVVLGALTGVLAVRGVPAVHAGLAPLVGLVRAALPLTMPLLVFLAAGVVKSSPELQFAAGMLTLLVAWALLIPDGRHVNSIKERRASRRRARSRDLPTDQPRRTAARIGRTAPAVVAALAAIAALGKSFVDLLGDADTTARSGFVLAFLLLATAAVFRLIGFATTVARAAVVLITLALLTRLAMEGGLLPGDNAFGRTDLPDLAIAAGVLFGVVTVIEVVTSVLTSYPDDSLAFRVAVKIETPVTGGRVTGWASIIGSAFAVAASASLLAAAIAASTTGGAKEALDLAAPKEPPVPPRTPNKRVLAETFSPVLLLTGDERWTPTPVDDYVHGATITDWAGRTETVDSVADLPKKCPGLVNRPCYDMVERCPEGKDAAACAEDLPDPKAVYVRVAKRAAWTDCKLRKSCVDGSPDPFAGATGRYAVSTETLIQYWYFFPYDEWVSPVAVGELTQVHAADWEAVTVGLSKENVPLWVAYSAHCAGTYADWSEVRISREAPGLLRPLVAVAVGSHANYRVAEEDRVPNFAECSGISKDRLRLLSYAANIRDRTDDGRVWDPAPADIRMVTARSRPMNFPGRWGPFDRMRLKTFHKDLKFPAKHGPASPPLQALWQAPMRNIFGGRVWKEG
jgi:hypothetical protein